jgi:2-dehydropantoate 2-reductase
MNVVVMGAGAVGATFGARLAQAGHGVCFVARGDHLRALRRNGLRLRSTLGDAHLQPVTVIEDPAEAGTADLVLFAVKAQDSEAAARSLAPIVGPETRVLTLQNGIDGVEVLRRAFGEERVFGGVAYLEAVIQGPGEIVHKSPFARVVFGPLAGPDPRADATLEAFTAAGVEASLVEDPMEAVWRKWLLICAFSGLTALTRKPIGAVVQRAETRSLLRAAMQEIADLASAAGVTLPGDAVDAAMELVTRTFEPGMTSSLAQDLAAGKPLELEALNGAASRWGRDLGVPTPVNDFVYAALVLHVAGTA